MSSQHSSGYKGIKERLKEQTTILQAASILQSSINFNNLQLCSTTAKMRSSILIVALLLAIIAVACSAQRDGGGRGGGRGRPRDPLQGGREQDRSDSDSSQGE